MALDLGSKAKTRATFNDTVWPFYTMFRTSHKGLYFLRYHSFVGTLDCMVVLSVLAIKHEMWSCICETTNCTVAVKGVIRVHLGAKASGFLDLVWYCNPREARFIKVSFGPKPPPRPCIFSTRYLKHFLNILDLAYTRWPVSWYICCTMLIGGFGLFWPVGSNVFFYLMRWTQK